jgi:hypothetical protein
MFTAASDMNSTIPVFYSIINKSIYLTSSEFALARFLKVKMDSFGFSQAICLGSVWGELSRFKNLKKLSPAQIIQFNSKGVFTSEIYWTPREESLWTGHFDEVLAKWSHILRDSVRMYFNESESKSVVTDFSAGEDARLILAQCHALNIPYTAWVSGFKEDIDMIIANYAAKTIGFQLNIGLLSTMSPDELIKNAVNICVSTDSYEQFFKACLQYDTILSKFNNGFKHIHFTGIPGGAAFRGEYYLRGLALLPNQTLNKNFKYFIKKKFLLEHKRGLIKINENDFFQILYKNVFLSLKDVDNFPDGIKVDHILRIYQTSLWGLKYRYPIYLPCATIPMTRSIYNIHPNFKKGGRLTKACTENLFPKLALLKTQHGVPTIRKTFKRTHLFIPEYTSKLRILLFKILRRKLNIWSSSILTQNYLRTDINSSIYMTILSEEPYSKWFSSTDNMLTGCFYNSPEICSFLSKAKHGQCLNLNLLSRIIGNEIGCRWVYNSI